MMRQIRNHYWLVCCSAISIIAWGVHLPMRPAAAQTGRNTGSIGFKCFSKELGSYPAFGTATYVIDMLGDTVATSNYWKGIFEKVPAGTYQLLAMNGALIQRDTVVVHAERQVFHAFVFDVETGGIRYSNTLRGARDSPAYGAVTKIRHSGGEVVYSGNKHSATVNHLPVGQYHVDATHTGMAQTSKVDVTKGHIAAVQFDFPLEAGKITYECFLDSNLARPAYGTRVMIKRVSTDETVLVDTSRYRGTTRNLPIGEYAISGSLMGKTVTQILDLGAGENINSEVILDIKQVRMSYECYRNRQQQAANGAEVAIYNMDGLEVASATGWRGNFILPTGTYTLLATWENKTARQLVNLLPTLNPNDPPWRVYFQE